MTSDRASKIWPEQREPRIKWARVWPALGCLFGASLLLGLVLTLGSLVVTGELPRVADGDGGPRAGARLFGAPAPWAFVLTSDTERPGAAREVWCMLAGCNPGERFEGGGLPVVFLPFMFDWVFWSALSLAGLLLLAACLWIAGLLRSRLSPSRTGP